MDGGRICGGVAQPACQRYGSSGPNVYSLALTRSWMVISLRTSSTKTATRGGEHTQKPWLMLPSCPFGTSIKEKQGLARIEMKEQ